MLQSNGDRLWIDLMAVVGIVLSLTLTTGVINFLFTVNPTLLIGVIISASLLWMAYRWRTGE